MTVVDRTPRIGPRGWTAALVLGLLVLSTAASLLGTGGAAASAPRTFASPSAVPSNGAAPVTPAASVTLPPATTIPVGNGPDSVAVDPANATAFVANQYTNNVTLISMTTDRVLESISVGSEPAAIAVDSANGTAYVANAGSANVSAVSLSDEGVSANIPVGNSPDAIVFDTLNGYVYVANGGSGTVSVIASVTNAVVATIPVGADPDGIAVDTQNKQVFVADAGSDNVSVISGVSNVVVGTVFVGTSPGADGSIAYDAVDHDIFVACVGSDNVTVIGGTNHTVIATPFVGSGPSGIAIDAVQGDVFVANHYSDNVSVISAVNDTLITTLSVGSEPAATGGIAIDAATDLVYVANAGSDNVSVLSAVTDRVVTSVPVLEAPNAVAVNPTNGLVYVVDQGSANVSAFALASVSFSEKGLPVGSSWSVAGGVPVLVRTNTTVRGGGSVSFLALAGPFSYVISGPAGWGVALVTGTGTPTQSELDVSTITTLLHVTFGKLEVLTFSASGLPVGASWGIALTAGPAHGGAAGQSATTTLTTLAFTVVQGSWKFQVTPKPSEYAAAPAHGSVGVPTHAVTKVIRFSLMTEKVTFREAGLHSGTRWQVNLTGPENLTLTTTGSSLTVKLPNGTYTYAVANVGGMHPTPTGGTLTIATPGPALTVYVTFADPPGPGGLGDVPVVAVAVRSSVAS